MRDFLLARISHLIRSSGIDEYEAEELIRNLEKCMFSYMPLTTKEFTTLSLNSDSEILAATYAHGSLNVIRALRVQGKTTDIIEAKKIVDRIRDQQQTR